MSNIIESLKAVETAIAKNNGKPIPACSVPNAESLQRRGYVNLGNANTGRVLWLTDKAKVELEDTDA